MLNSMIPNYSCALIVASPKLPADVILRTPPLSPMTQLITSTWPSMDSPGQTYYQMELQPWISHSPVYGSIEYLDSDVDASQAMDTTWEDFIVQSPVPQSWSYRHSILLKDLPCYKFQDDF